MSSNMQGYGQTFLPTGVSKLFSIDECLADHQVSSVHFSRSVVSDSLRPHNCSTPGLPVRHHLPEFTQTHVHRVGDAIQPSHPLSSPSPPAFNLSQHQSLNFQMSQFFTSGGQSIGVSASASVLPKNIQVCICI